MILIVDFGSQTAHLIGRRLRQLGVEIDYVNPEDALTRISHLSPLTSHLIKGIILSGGPSSVYDKGAPSLSKSVFELGIPVLGICYGWQLMAKELGGSVKSATKEYGPEKINVIPDPDRGSTKIDSRLCGNDGEKGGNDKKDKQTLLSELPEQSFQVIVSHGDSVTILPKEFITTASTRTVQFAAVENSKKNLYGVQFHPEANHTEYGLEILRNFAKICNEELKPIALDPQKIISAIKETVSDRKVICAVSGGVDSTVAAFLIGKAIGKNLIPVYVESGLMRAGTDELVKYIFSELIRSDLVIIDARKRFIKELKGVTDPEQKRKTIGCLYVEIFQDVAKDHPEASFLGQGTIYSDIIESKGSKHASHIKSHHNVGGLPKDMHLKLLEPMRNYYKDEVREIGRLAGIPEEIVMQQPFPGPGYAVRIRGEVTPERLEQVKIADQIVIEESKSAGFYEKVFQCFALMTGAYSTAVKGDERVFAEVVGIRAYESADVMTSQWARLPYDLLQKISSRIVNEVPDVSRVVYDITTKPPATMEWE